MQQNSSISEARAFVDRLGASLPKEVDVAALGVTSKAPFQLLCAREALIWRTEELARNACDALERNDFAAAALLTRGVTESAGLVWKLMELLDARKSYSPQEMNDHLMRALLGWKADTGDFPEAYNVLTLVQRMDNVIEGVFHTYGTLSEIAHPNWSGVLALYGKTDRENFVTYFGRALENADRNGDMVASALLGSLGCFEYAYNKISDAMPVFLAELEKLSPEVAEAIQETKS
jgi:hypothetical protein